MIFYHQLSPILITLGPISLRWYGLMFALGILLNYVLLFHVFKKQKHSIAHLDSIALYLFVGMLIGARLGHIIFYNLSYFLSHPLEILQVWHGGLASHGAAIGLFAAYYIWCKKHKVALFKYIDIFAMGIPISAMFVRIGNFFNSEIVGKATDGSWGVVFEKIGEDFPRHPSQLYEAGLNFFIIILFLYLYKTRFNKLPKFFFLGTYLMLYFGGRFFLEFYKDLHALPESFPLSMGQVLSVVPVMIGVWLLTRSRYNQSS